MQSSISLSPIKFKSQPDYRFQKHCVWVYRYREILLAFAGLFLIVFSTYFAEYLTPYDPHGPMNLTNRLLPPLWENTGSIVHPLGTDNMGRDILSRTLHGGWVSLTVAFAASTFASLIGIVVGLAAGYVGGIVDRFILGFSDIWLSFPFLVLALAVIASVGSSMNVLIVLLTLAGWVHSARVTRAQTLRIKQLDFVHASIAFGASPLHIVWRHVLPGILNVNIVMWTFSVGALVLVEGSLSFVGMGVNPGTPSWGNMLSDGRMYLQSAWWMSIFPGIALMLTILSVNSLGDALQKLNNQRF